MERNQYEIIRNLTSDMAKFEDGSSLLNVLQWSSNVTLF